MTIALHQILPGTGRGTAPRSGGVEGAPPIAPLSPNRFAQPVPPLANRWAQPPAPSTTSFAGGPPPHAGEDL